MGNEYLAKQKALVDKLKELGLVYEPNARLDLFMMYNYLPNLTPELYQLIDDLVAMRKQGLEPKHKDGLYHD